MLLDVINRPSRVAAAVVVLACSLGFASPTRAHVAPPADPVETFDEFEPVHVAGPFQHPWSIGFLPDRSILLTERAGRLQLIRPGSPPREVRGVPAVLFRDHAGLFDVAVDPDFASNATVYLSYAHGTAERSTVRVLRARLDLRRAALRDKRVIFESTAAPRTEQYGGGRMAVTEDGFLFLTLGDRWERERAQNLADHAGSIVRIRTDGTVPDDNPFIRRPDALPEIWSYGHRNQLGLAFDRRSGDLWSHENGPRGGDELNLILRGRNYGWPVISHGREYSGEPVGEGTAKDGMEQPVRHWTPAIAPSGLALQHEKNGAVLWVGTLAGQSVIRLMAEGGRITDERRLLENELGRIRDVALDPDGQLYLIVDDEQGSLYRLDPVVAQAGRREPGRGPL